MRERIVKWGDSLAIRIPDEIAEAVGLKDGGEVELSVANGQLIVERKLSLDEMIALVTPENRHGEIDWGPPVGREFTGDAWEECQPGCNPWLDFDPPSTPR